MKNEATKNTTGLKGSRWTKIHQQGQANFESKSNVIDITVGEDRRQAEVTYETSQVRNYKKAAYWIFHSLEKANALDITAMAAERVLEEVVSASEDAPEFEVHDSKWSCEIQNMGGGVFKVRVSWSTSNESELPEEITVVQEEEEVKPKKRTRRKKAAE